MELERRLTIVVTTSPIPSHPSPALLRALFASFAAQLPGAERCRRLLVSDGYRRSTSAGSSKPQLCSEEAYADFLGQVDEMVAAGELGPCQVLKLEAVHGYGLALGRALERVDTEFVLVVQHDWLFVRPADLSSALAAMDRDPEVKYIGMQSLTTLDYARRVRTRHDMHLPPSRTVCGVRLTPQLFWYDKPHVCRVQHYREVVLREAPHSVGECPERKYGLELMWPQLRRAAASELEATHRRFGVFFWDVGEEVIYHLSGRKLQAADAASAHVMPVAEQGTAGASLEAELRGEARMTATYTAVAAERAALVPGLAPARSVGERALAAGGDRPKFKGRCFICGMKGHSKLLCPSRAEVPDAANAEGCGSLVIAGC